MLRLPEALRRSLTTTVPPFSPLLHALPVPLKHAYIENVFEELDSPGEWFFDAASSQLFVLPNMSVPELQAATLAMPVLDSVIVVNGSQTAAGAFASSISFAGFTVTQTRVTYLEIFQIPSGGDWSVHRGASLFVQDSENITVAGLRFDQVGGNAIILSNHVAGSTVADNEVELSGDSAIVSLGSTNLIDGSAPTYPTGNLIARNHLHSTGVYTKQTSCYAHQLSANATIVDNVCYNGPRAGVNINDGFFGANLFAGESRSARSASLHCIAATSAVFARARRPMLFHIRICGSPCTCTPLTRAPPQVTSSSTLCAKRATMGPTTRKFLRTALPQRRADPRLPRRWPPTPAKQFSQHCNTTTLAFVLTASRSLAAPPFSVRAGGTDNHT